MKKQLLISLAAVILIAAACNKTTTPAATPAPAQEQPAASTVPDASSTNPATAPAPSPETSTKVDIAITSAGFEPATVTIKKGMTVVFTNKDTKAHVPASGPHPTHTNYPGFDAQNPIKTGETYSFTFDKVGTWGYHDHLDSKLTGKIIVTE